MHLYLIGGEQKRRFVIGDDDEHHFKTAIIVQLDTDSGVAKLEAKYQTPLSVKCHPDSYLTRYSRPEDCRPKLDRHDEGH